MFNKNLKRIRTQNGLTQKSVADFLHISPQSISKWENGEATPSIEFLPLLAQLFKCSIDEFFKENRARPIVNDVKKFLSFLQYFEKDQITESDITPTEFMSENCGWQDNCKTFYSHLAEEKFIDIPTLQTIAECDTDVALEFAALLEESNVLTKVPNSKLYVINQETVGCSFSMIKASRVFEALGQGKSVNEAIESIG